MYPMEPLSRLENAIKLRHQQKSHKTEEKVRVTGVNENRAAL